MQGIGGTEILSTSKIWVQTFRLPLKNRLPNNTEISPTSEFGLGSPKFSIFGRPKFSVFGRQNFRFLVGDISVKHAL